MLDTLSHTEREALCTRCGTSCHFAVDINEVPVVIDELRCRFLARASDGRYGCSVYDDRFERAPWCADLNTALAEGLLGQTCPYVVAQGDPEYAGKHRLTKNERQVALPIIRQALLSEGAPLGACHDGLRDLLATTGGGQFVFVEDEENDTLWVVHDET